MEIKNKLFYFGKIPNDIIKELAFPEGWTEPYYFRIRVDGKDEEIKVEDTCGRMVPFNWYDIWQFQQTLTQVQNELLTSLIGAPRNA